MTRGGQLLVEGTRTLQAAWFLGLDDLVKYLLRKYTVCGHYLHGYEKLNEQVRYFVCISAVASYIPDAALALLMADDRMVRRAFDVQTAMEEELRFIDSLSNFYWNRIHTVSGGLVTAFTLRSDAMKAAFTAYAFVMHKVVKPYLQPPFSLCRGDIQQNLVELARSPGKPQNVVASKIWSLLREHGCCFLCKT